MLAVGLGVGAAVASAPGIASADPSSDVFSSIDWGGLLSPALAVPESSAFQVSFDGTDLFPTAGNLATATTTPGDFSLAIAIGNGADATATHGIGDYALANGTNALAVAGGDSTGNGNFDSAIDIGTNTLGGPGAHDGAYAGAGDIGGIGSGTGAGSYDTAIDIGNNAPDAAGAGGNDGAFAGAGGLIGLSGNGNNDFAIDFGNNSGENLGPAAVGGIFDTAIQNGNSVGENGGAFAGFGNNNTAIDTATFGGAIHGGGASATFGDNDFASVLGDLSHAHAGGVGNFGDLAASVLGNNDSANVFDPFETAGSFATAGAGGGVPGDFDFASVFGDGLTATATGANFLTEILPTLF